MCLLVLPRWLALRLSHVGARPKKAQDSTAAKLEVTFFLAGEGGPRRRAGDYCDAEHYQELTVLRFNVKTAEKAFKVRLLVYQIIRRSNLSPTFAFRSPMCSTLQTTCLWDPGVFVAC